MALLLLLYSRRLCEYSYPGLSTLSCNLIKQSLFHTRYTDLSCISPMHYKDCALLFIFSVLFIPLGTGIIIGYMKLALSGCEPDSFVCGLECYSRNISMIAQRNLTSITTEEKNELCHLISRSNIRSLNDSGILFVGIFVASGIFLLEISVCLCAFGCYTENGFTRERKFYRSFYRCLSGPDPDNSPARPPESTRERYRQPMDIEPGDQPYISPYMSPPRSHHQPYQSTTSHSAPLVLPAPPAPPPIPIATVVADDESCTSVLDAIVVV